MNRDGHYGVVLLVYSPIGFTLAAAGYGQLAVLGGLGLLVLVMLPDYDLYVPLVPHRGPTHSVTFALVVGLALAIGMAIGIRDGVLGWLTASTEPSILVAGAALVGSCSVIVHLLGDVLTPMGIRPFWPISSYHVSLNLTRAANPISNTILLGAGLGAAGLATALLVG